MSIAFPLEESSRFVVPVKPRTSERRIRANRANARQSTGPRTSEGKKRASQNARKHGLCSVVAPLPNECEAAYLLFKDEIEAEMKPRTVVQKHLFDQIAALMWKLRRIPHAEREMFAIESRNVLAPCEALAKRMSEDKSNGFILLNRYERSMQNMLLRLMRQFEQEKKHRNVTAADEERAQIKPEMAWDEHKERWQREFFERKEKEIREKVEKEIRSQIEAEQNLAGEAETTIPADSEPSRITKRSQRRDRKGAKNQRRKQELTL